MGMIPGSKIRELIDQYEFETADAMTSLVSDLEDIVRDSVTFSTPEISLELARDMVIRELSDIEKSPQMDNINMHPVIPRLFTEGIHAAIARVSKTNTFSELDMEVSCIWRMSLQEWLNSVPWLR